MLHIVESDILVHLAFKGLRSQENVHSLGVTKQFTHLLGSRLIKLLNNVGLSKDVLHLLSFEAMESSCQTDAVV